MSAVISSEGNGFTGVNLEPMALSLELPWVADQEREEKFKRWVQRSLIAAVVFMFVMQFLPVFELDEKETVELVKTTVMLEQKKEPQPTPIDEPKKRIIKPLPKKTVATKAVKTPQAAPKQPEQDIVASQGLDALSTQLSSLTSSVDTQKLRKKNTTSSERGMVANDAAERLSKDNVTQRSGGYVVDDQLMRANVSSLESHQAAEVEGLNMDASVLASNDRYGNLKQGLRDTESIRRVLEAAKSRLSAVYQRELVNNPELAGEFVFRLVIEPDGSISDIALVSSELRDDALNQKLLNQISTVAFGAADVLTTDLTYKFRFLPS